MNRICENVYLLAKDISIIILLLLLSILIAIGHLPFGLQFFLGHLLLLLSTEFFFDIRNSVLRDIMPSLFWARIVCWLCLGWILVFPVGFPENRLCCPNCSLGLAIGFDMTAGGGRCHDPCLNCHFFRNSMNSQYVYTIHVRYTQSELSRLYV